MTTAMFPELGHWLPVKDGDDRARALYLRHYSSAGRSKPRQQWSALIGHPNSRLFAGSGETTVLLTPDADAVFVWQHSTVDRLSGQVGVCCTLFRNESRLLSSDLIREADALAWQRWPGVRHFTYVNTAKIRSTNPGYCFTDAGWRRCGMSKGGLVILECLPS